MATMNENLTSFMEESNEHSEFRVLQPLWDLRNGYEYYMSSPLFPIITSIIFYFVMVLPWMIIDLYGQEWQWIQKYKIQPDKKVTWPMCRKAIMLTVWNHIIFILPVSVAQWMWAPPYELIAQAPTLWEFIWHQFASLAVFDFEYWAWHSIHHKVRFLYKHVHAIHHQYHAPNSWVTQYLHPWELISVGFFTTSSPWIFKAHPLTQLSFQQFAIVTSVDAHIGYDLPFMPHNWMPFWGGSIKHDMHHQKPLTNFEPFFSWWDRLFGWECPGQRAGGVKPEKLIAWEKKNKEAKAIRRQLYIAKDAVREEVWANPDEFKDAMEEDNKAATETKSEATNGMRLRSSAANGKSKDN